MGYMKCISGDYIASLHIVSGDGNVSKAEYDDLKSRFESRPTAPDGYQYFLQKDSLEWELKEIQSEPEPTSDEILNILLGGDDQ